MMNSISGKTLITGLIGFPVSHSLSPAMHNAAFQDAGLDFVYVCFQVQPEQVPEAVKGLKALNIRGMNVTIPHKEAVIPFLDEISEEAEKIGAVNTILNADGRLTGFNTDVYGYWKSLEIRDVEIRGAHTVIIGAGGVARAIAIGNALKEAASIIITDAIPEKARSLAQHVKKTFSSIEVRNDAPDSAHLPEALRRADLIINATPLGMKATDPLFIPEDRFEKISPRAVIFDAVYNLKESNVRKACEKKNITYIGGLDMLLYQGVRAFEIWTERTPNAILMKKVLREKLGLC